MNQAQNNVPKLALTRSADCSVTYRETTLDEQDINFDKLFLEENKGLAQDEALEALLLFSVYERALMPLDAGACMAYTKGRLDDIRWVLKFGDNIQKNDVTSHLMTQIKKINMDIELEKHGRRMSTTPIEKSVNLIDQLFDIVVDKKVFDKSKLTKVDDKKLYEQIKADHKPGGNCSIQ